MTKKQKNFYILAGPNGAGKTTLSHIVLKEVFHCNNFINADEIAKGLSPLQSNKFDIAAGKIMLQQMKHYLNLQESFCVETTLSTKLYLTKIQHLRKLGYKIFLFFIYLPSEEFAIERVKQRVLKGGHDIPKNVIRRRYQRGLSNLINDYYPYINNLYIYDNINKLKIVAVKNANKLTIHNEKIFNHIKTFHKELINK